MNLSHLASEKQSQIEGIRIQSSLIARSDPDIQTQYIIAGFHLLSEEISAHITFDSHFFHGLPDW